MPVAYGYCRASTAGQSLTFEVQRASITRYFKEKLEPDGWTFGGFFEDKATSGTKPLTEREQGRRLWVSAQPGDCIIWSKLDRAFRSVRDGANTLQLFKEKGVAIHSLDLALDTSTALGSFVMHLLVLLAELEREWISSRTKDALLARAEKGLPITVNIPPGWRKVKVGPNPTRPGKFVYRYEVDHKERALLDEVAQRREAGESYEKISNDLFFKRVFRHNAPAKNRWTRKHGQAGLYSTWFLALAMKCRERGYPLLTRKNVAESQDPALSS
jgi:DNA invertase Pin-like site-specific DNA recombinase